MAPLNKMEYVGQIHLKVAVDSNGKPYCSQLGTRVSTVSSQHAKAHNRLWYLLYAVYSALHSAQMHLKGIAQNVH